MSCFSVDGALVGQKLEEAASRAAEEEKKRLQTQVELQARFSTELEREKLVSTQAGLLCWLSEPAFGGGRRPGGRSEALSAWLCS